MELAVERDILNPVISPRVLANGVAVNSGWIEVPNDGAIFLVAKGAHVSAGSAPSITLQQANTSGGGAAKALSPNATVRYGKTGAAVPASFTRTVVAMPDTIPAAHQGLVGYLVRIGDLDFANGFRWVQLAITATTADGQGYALSVVSPARNKGDTVL